MVNHDNGEVLKMGQIRDSNRPTLIAATKAAGFDCLDLGIAPDRYAYLKQVLQSTTVKLI